MNATEARQPRTLREISGHAWRLYFTNFVPLFGLALLTLPIQMLVGTIQDRISSQEAQANVTALLFLPSVVVSLVASSAIIHAANVAISGGHAEIGAAIDAAFSRLRSVISSFMLALLLTVASLVAFPYFAVRWTFQSQAVMVEGKRNWPRSMRVRRPSKANGGVRSGFSSSCSCPSFQLLSCTGHRGRRDSFR